MDKETAVEIERLKGDVRANKRTIDDLVEAKKSWDSLVKDTVIRTLKWLAVVTATGFTFGWQMPENIRKVLAEWLGK